MPQEAHVRAAFVRQRAQPRRQDRQHETRDAVGDTEPRRAGRRVLARGRYCLKNSGKNTTITVVANAELAQSYSAQAKTFFSNSGDFTVDL